MIGSTWIPVDSPVGYHGTDREDERWLADLPLDSVSGAVRIDVDLAGVFLASTADLPYEFRLRIGGNRRSPDGEQILLLTGTGVTQAQIDAGADGIGQAHAAMDLLPVTAPLTFKLTGRSATHGQMIRIRGGSVRVQFSPVKERPMGESTIKGTDIWFDIAGPGQARLAAPCVGLLSHGEGVGFGAQWQSEAGGTWRLAGAAGPLVPQGGTVGTLDGDRIFAWSSVPFGPIEPQAYGPYEVVDCGDHWDGNPEHVRVSTQPIIRRASDANAATGIRSGMVVKIVGRGTVEHGGEFFALTTIGRIVPDVTPLAFAILTSYTEPAALTVAGAAGEPNTLVTVSGDWALVDGHEAVVQSLTRRYLTSPGEWKTKPEYGAGLREAARKRARGSDIAEIVNRMRQQNSLEKRISPKSEVSVYPLSGNVNGLGFKVTIIFSDDVNATPRTFTGVVPA